MCGIWAYITLQKSSLSILELFKDFYELRNRGPNYQSFEQYGDQLLLGFSRLAIVDNSMLSNQPFQFEDNCRTIVFVANGEIYNYKELMEKYSITTTNNDCKVLAEIYFNLVKEGKEDAFFNCIQNDVKGEYSFLIFQFDDLNNIRKIVAGRDEVGVRPLYYHPVSSNDTTLFFTSELKGGMTFADKLEEFPPGFIITYDICELGSIKQRAQSFSSIYNETKINETKINETKINEDTTLDRIKVAVINSVRRRLSADKPFAFLLSGGVDSSLVAAISSKLLGKPIRTFCCGMKGGTDFKYAQMVARYIGSAHTEIIFTAEEALSTISDVIKTVETWDTTTIRASVAQYLVSKYIGTHTDCRVVMVGEGPDEVCSSYLFNWYAPNGAELDKVAKKSVQDIHYYDVKRADRCISRWGLEGRVPLLDTEFIKEYWSIPPEKRMPAYKQCEKWWLREAFRDTNILPDEVLFRKKEALSDGISASDKSWFQIIQEWVEEHVTESEMTNAHITYPYCTPYTKEAYYYRRIFCSTFGEHRQDVIPGYWQPKWSSDGKEVTGYIDPSARTLNIY
jgi:asparagine synthase (glutamine-hydrolysing)